MHGSFVSLHQQHVVRLLSLQHSPHILQSPGWSFVHIPGAVANICCILARFPAARFLAALSSSERHITMCVNVLQVAKHRLLLDVGDGKVVKRLVLLQPRFGVACMKQQLGTTSHR